MTSENKPATPITVSGLQVEIARLQTELERRIRDEERSKQFSKIDRLEKSLKGVVDTLNRFKRERGITLSPVVSLDAVDEQIRMAIEEHSPRDAKMYEICEDCNRGGHTCPGCGHETNHTGIREHWKTPCT